MNLGERLYSFRKSKNLSQEEVANMLNVTRQTVSKWETGQSAPDFDRIVPLCELYEISTDELFTGKRSIDKNIIYDNCDNNNRKARAFSISFSVFLYFLAVIWIIVFEPVSFISSNLLVGIFLFICALSTFNLIYKLMSIPKTPGKDAFNSNKYKIIDDVVSMIFLLIYLILSFITSAWSITWITWILYAIILKIIHLMLGVVKDEEK